MSGGVRPDAAATSVPFNQPGVWQAEALPASFDFKKYEADVQKVTDAGKLGDLAGENPPPIKTGGWNDTRNDVDADGKYLLLAVPEYKPGLSSYLRLGAACSFWDTALGNELEKIIHLTGPVGKTTTLPFIDDERSRGGAEVHPGVGATVDESAILHTKGGWRDHSDGNRITTTYGDKIEIIRGNYKMVVMGRQDSPADSSGWDTSGQHIQDWGYSMPGASVTLEWVPLYGGTWLLKNSTEIFHSWNRTAGNKRDEYWGDLLETYIGQESPGTNLPQQPAWPGGEPNPVLKSNPEIVERTWAKSISSHTGSAALPVPTIEDHTWVGTTAEALDADTVTSTTNVSGSITEATTVGGAITSATTAAVITDVTTAGAVTSITTAAAMIDIAVGANKTDIYVGATQIDIDIALLQFELSFGAKLEINLTKTAKFTAFDEKKLNMTKDEVSMENRLVAMEAAINALQANIACTNFNVISILARIGV